MSNNAKTLVVTGCKFCPKCKCDSYVMDSRAEPDGTIRRRCICQRCQHRWTTLEIAVPDGYPGNMKHLET